MSDNSLMSHPQPPSLRQRQMGLVGRQENRKSGEDGFCLRTRMRKFTKHCISALFKQKTLFIIKLQFFKKRVLLTHPQQRCVSKEHNFLFVALATRAASHLGLALRPNNINVASRMCFQLLPLKKFAVNHDSFIPEGAL